MRAHHCRQCGRSIELLDNDTYFFLSTSCHIHRLLSSKEQLRSAWLSTSPFCSSAEHDNLTLPCGFQRPPTQKQHRCIKPAILPLFLLDTDVPEYRQLRFCFDHALGCGILHSAEGRQNEIEVGGCSIYPCMVPLNLPSGIKTIFPSESKAFPTFPLGHIPVQAILSFLIRPFSHPLGHNGTFRCHVCDLVRSCSVLRTPLHRNPAHLSQWCFIGFKLPSPFCFIRKLYE